MKFTQAEYRKLDKLVAREKKTKTKITTAFIEKVGKGKSDRMSRGKLTNKEI